MLLFIALLSMMMSSAMSAPTIVGPDTIGDDTNNDVGSGSVNWWAFLGSGLGLVALLVICCKCCAPNKSDGDTQANDKVGEDVKLLSVNHQDDNDNQ